MAQPQLAEKTSAPTTYTFGDNDLAAERLRLLAEAFAPSSRAFAARLGREPVRLAIDLGCGPGYTTALLAAATGAAATIGLDSSPRFLARAWRQAPRGVAFGEHDVTRVPFPAPPADLIYGRFIVTHLPDAGAAIARWAEALVPRGRLALEEVDTMTSDDPTLVRYYALVEAMQAARGQSHLRRARARRRWRRRRPSSSSGPTPCRSCCRRRRPRGCTRSTSGPGGEIPSSSPASIPASSIDLGASLEALATGARAAAPVRWKMAQVVLRRR